MIELSISEWPYTGAGGLTHNTSDWELSSNSDYTDIVDSIYDSSTMKTYWNSSAIIPVGKTYYARVRRHLSDDSITPWVNREVNSESFTSLLNFGRTKIEPPLMDVSFQYGEYGEESYIIINTSEFISEKDTHYSTDWLLCDSTGKVILSNVGNRVDKTKKVITTYDIDFTALTGFTVKVAYTGLSGNRSEFTSKDISVNGHFFSITSDLTSVSPFMDYKLTWENTLNDQDVESPPTRLKLLNGDGLELLNTPISGNEFTISRDYLYEGTSYTLLFLNGDYDTYPAVVSFKTLKDIETYPIEPEFANKGVYVASTTICQDYLKTFNSSQLMDNAIPTCDNNGLELYFIDPVTDTFIKSNLPDLLNGYSDMDQVNIFPYKNNIVIVDYVNTTSEQRSILLVDYYTMTVINEFELYIGANNFNKPWDFSIDNASEVGYYLSPSTGNYYNLWSIDLSTGDKTDLGGNSIDTDNANVVYVGDGNILLINGNNQYGAYIYNIRDSLWRKIDTLTPDIFDRVLVPFRSKNGNILFFNYNIANATNDVLVFDTVKYVFTNITSTIDQAIALTTTIRLRNGSFIRFVGDDTDKQLYYFV